MRSVDGDTDSSRFGMTAYTKHAVPIAYDHRRRNESHRVGVGEHGGGGACKSYLLPGSSCKIWLFYITLKLLIQAPGQWHRSWRVWGS